MPKLHALVPLALVLAIQPARAEFARIRDPDASANLRNEPRNTAPIAAKIPNGAYVYTPEPNSGGYRQNGWQFVVYRQNGRLLEGWMHGSRLQPLSRYAAVPVKAAADGFSCISGGSGIRVRVGRFDFAREKPHFNSTQNGRITRYRDREIYGTDGTVPQTHFREIAFISGGKAKPAPAAQYAALFNPYIGSQRETADRSRCYRAPDGAFLLASAISDGAAYTEVLFVFRQGSLHSVAAYVHPDV